MLAYLTRSPAGIDVVDLNTAHVALNRLKLAAVRHLPTHGDLLRFFGGAGTPANTLAYDRYVRPRLDETSRAYWEKRTWRGRRRIAVFERNFYRTGLLGLFIAAGHRMARPARRRSGARSCRQARTLREQRQFFDEYLAPLFETPLLRWSTSMKASLFGLGIPPAQYDSLLSSGDGTMAGVLSVRLEKLACHFPIRDNYFAWQAFARRYPEPGEGALPAYLEPANHAVLRANAGRVAVHHVGFAELLQRKPAASIDRFVLLDAQDWMSDAQLDTLWTEITRTAAPGARVIFRTAAEPTLLPGRVRQSLLSRWRYEEEASRAFTARDRSAIYGGFHLYVLNAR